MPSRKPPSQRDPLARMSQAVRAGSPASMGGRVANAAPVKATGTSPHRTVAPPAAAGGGATGTATYRFTFTPGAITSANVALVHATDVELLDSIGDHGVYAAIPDGLLTTPGVYVAGSSYYMQATTNAVSSDSHAVNYGNIDTKLLLGANVYHTHGNTFAFDVAPGGSGLVSPCFQVYCPGGTNRVYQLDRNRVDVLVMRWDRPSG